MLLESASRHTRNDIYIFTVVLLGCVACRPVTGFALATPLNFDHFSFGHRIKSSQCHLEESFLVHDAPLSPSFIYYTSAESNGELNGLISSESLELPRVP